MNFCRLTIQEPIFSVSNAEFEGGDDVHGHGDCTFLVKQAQPSHSQLGAHVEPRPGMVSTSPKETGSPLSTPEAGGC
jgi:hypothetical protein